MRETHAAQEVRQLVQDLLSRDAVVFNAAINAHFASECTYRGRGLEIHGVSQLKHASWLANLVDFGSPVQIADKQVRWNKESLTAVIQTHRYARPAVFPIFQFAVPTTITLVFNADVDSAKGTLFCTQVVDEWPVDPLLDHLPMLGRWYKSICVPLLSAVVMFVANIAFCLHTRLASYAVAGAYIEPKLSNSWLRAYQTGVSLAGKVSQQSSHVVSRAARGPLRLVERMAQTGTAACNVALPKSLQLPRPYVYAEQSHIGELKSDDSTSSAESSVQLISDVSLDDDSTQRPVEPAQTDEQAQPIFDPPQNDSAESKAEEPDDQRSATPVHAQVVIGSPEDASQKTIDLVTKQVTETAPDMGSVEPGKLQPSLYDELQRHGQLPDSNSAVKPHALPVPHSAGPRSQSGSVKRKKSSKKKGKPAPPREFNLSKPSNDTPSPTSPKSAKGSNH